MTQSCPDYRELHGGNGDPIIQLTAGTFFVRGKPLDQTGHCDRGGSALAEPLRRDHTPYGEPTLPEQQPGPLRRIAQYVG